MDFNFTTVAAPQKLNKDFVLSKITDVMIFGYYHGPFKIGDIYPSKFRRDRNPSCGFYVSSSGKLIYNDLSNSEKADAFAFVQKLYNLSFADAVKRIALDFGLIKNSPSPMASEVMHKLQNFDKKSKKDTKIHFVADKWGADNLAFWKQHHITKDELKADGIYPIKSLYLNERFVKNPGNNVRYALTQLHKGEMLVKVYTPGGGDAIKWLSNIPLDAPFGLDTLDKSAPFVFVSKARKDRLILKKFLPAVISANNESIAAMPKKVREKLKFYYPKRYCGYDIDEAGIEAMIAMAEEGYYPLHVYPDYLDLYGIKDFADLAREKGLGAVEQLLREHKLVP